MNNELLRAEIISVVTLLNGPSAPDYRINEAKRKLNDALASSATQPQAAMPEVSAAERKLLDAAKSFAKEHIEGDALHDDDSAPDAVVHASDERYNEAKRLLCDAYLELAAAPPSPQPVAESVPTFTIAALPHPSYVKGCHDYYSVGQMEEYGKACWSQALAEADIIHKDLIKTMAESTLAAAPDEPVAYMLPKDIEKLSRGEEHTTAFGVDVTNTTTGERSVPVYLRPTPAIEPVARLTDADIERRVELAHAGGKAAAYRDLLKLFPKLRGHVANLMAHHWEITAIEMQDKFSLQTMAEGRKPSAPERYEADAAIVTRLHSPTANGPLDLAGNAGDQKGGA